MKKGIDRRDVNRKVKRKNRFQKKSKENVEISIESEEKSKNQKDI